MESEGRAQVNAFVQELTTQRGKNEKRVKEDLKVKIEELKDLKKPLETRAAAAERKVGQRAPSPPIMDGLMTTPRSYYQSITLGAQEDS